MAPFDRSYTTNYSSAIGSIALSCTIFELFDVRDLEIWVKVTEVIENGTIRMPGYGFLFIFTMAVSLAVYETFSVK